jgi:hypothetical protein
LTKRQINLLFRAIGLSHRLVARYLGFRIFADNSQAVLNPLT